MKDDDDTSYLSAANRRFVIGAELSGSIHAAQGSGSYSAFVSIGSQRIYSVSKPSLAVLSKQLDWVRSYADLRADRITEVNLQIGDLLSFYGGVGFLNSSARKYSLELLTLAQKFTIQLEMLVKHYCRSPRPIDLEPRVFPNIQTPDHSTFPSGHATEAFVLATVLHRLMTGQGPATGVAADALPFRVAHRIAVGRTVAGVHYPVDSAAGALAGCAIAEAIFAVAREQRPFISTFAVSDALSEDEDHLFTKESDFTLKWLSAKLAEDEKKNDIVMDQVPELPLIGWLWGQAEQEWSR